MEDSGYGFYAFHAQAGRQVRRRLQPIAPGRHRRRAPCRGNRQTRKAVFNPDGTNDKIWNIDKGQPLTPTVGQVYVNRGGGRYLCRALVTDHGTQYFNAAGCSSSTIAVFRNVKSGWTFTAKGVIQYVDGTIEWDHSSDGCFKEVEDE